MIANQDIERYFYIFVNYQQKDQIDKLPKTEFLANNNNFTFIELFPFFAFKSQYLCKNLDISDFSNIIICNQINKRKNHKYFGKYIINLEIYSRIFNETTDQLIKLSE